VPPGPVFLGPRLMGSERGQAGTLPVHISEEELLTSGSQSFVSVTTGLDQLWVADITFVRVLEEFAFLAVVLDAFSRKFPCLSRGLRFRLALLLISGILYRCVDLCSYPEQGFSNLLNRE
jgi:hypothetical protein